MREIKFRAWFRGYADKSRRLSGNQPHMLFDQTPGDSLRWLAEGQPLDVMQFTGLQDAKGKDIYEGDLVTSDVIYLFDDSDILKQPAEVFWSDKGCASLRLGNRTRTMDETLAGWLGSVLAVIGNIYENPELTSGPSSEAQDESGEPSSDGEVT